MTRARVTFDQFADRVRLLDDDLREAVIRALRRSAMRLERYVVEEIEIAEPYPAVDRGELRASVSNTRVADGAVVTVDAPHAVMIERGTRPFRPPLAPLAEWALRKGLAEDARDARRFARAVADKFAREGIRPRWFFRKAWGRMVEGLDQDIQVELERLRRSRGA